MKPAKMRFRRHARYRTICLRRYEPVRHDVSDGYMRNVLEALSGLIEKSNRSTGPDEWKRRTREATNAQADGTDSADTGTADAGVGDGGEGGDGGDGDGEGDSGDGEPPLATLTTFFIVFLFFIAALVFAQFCLANRQALLFIASKIFSLPGAAGGFLWSLYSYRRCPRPNFLRRMACDVLGGSILARFLPLPFLTLSVETIEFLVGMCWGKLVAAMSANIAKNVPANF
jgi:hypothetical protein